MLCWYRPRQYMNTTNVKNMHLLYARSSAYTGLENSHNYTCGLDRKYRVLVSIVCLSVCLSVLVSWCLSVCLSVLLSVCVSVCLSVCLSVSTITQKINGPILKFEYIVGYEKSSDEFDIGHCPIKVKVMV